MNVGLYDLDSHNFPNLALMKISAWHKSQGDNVEMINFSAAAYISCGAKLLGIRTES